MRPARAASSWPEEATGPCKPNPLTLRATAMFPKLFTAALLATLVAAVPCQGAGLQAEQGSEAGTAAYSSYGVYYWDCHCQSWRCYACYACYDNAYRASCRLECQGY